MDNSVGNGISQERNIKRREPHMHFFPDLWFLSWNKNFWNAVKSVWVEVCQNWPGDGYFNLGKSKLLERPFFSS